MGERESSGTYRLIWEVVRQIPRGRVATYGEIAREAGYPGQARLVGYALHSLPTGSGIPWHRVISAQGKISLPKANGAYREQKRLLIGEGIAFGGERIDLRRFGWLSSVRRKKVTR
ncbi:MAG: methylated-DNA--[protein]-cysteine S-methyltransferase [Ignavibacteria bacterium]|nr:methylated-DNA--[protein]-cysteine S-methyltransferase [Ignavibacteria bacterium]